MGGVFRRAPLTSSLILANILAYGITVVCGGGAFSISETMLVECGGLFGPLVVTRGEWWRLLSAVFLHGGPEHLGLNMVSLLIVGRMMELFFSRTVTLAIYFASGVTGFFVSLFLHPATVSIGASGAIFGLFGAIGGYALFHRERLGERFGIFMKEFGTVLGLNLILGLLIPSIDMSAHIGGVLLGFVGGYLAIRNLRVFGAFLLGTALVSVLCAFLWLPERYMIVFTPGNF